MKNGNLKTSNIKHEFDMIDEDFVPFFSFDIKPKEMKKKTEIIEVKKKSKSKNSKLF